MICFFLGAGASSAFGYPTTKEFKELLSNELKNRFDADGNLSSQEKIILTTLMHKYYTDIEYIFEFWKRIKQLNEAQEFSILKEFLSSYTWGVEFANVPNSKYTQGAELKNFLDYVDNLILLLTRRLYAIYSTKEENIDKCKKIYSPLLALINANKKTIFTVNYDGVIEQYCGEVEYTLKDGFEYDSKSNFMRWKPSTFDEVSDDKVILLYKLHGSLSWKQHKKHGIVKLHGVEKIMNDDWQFSNDLLVKPTLSPKEEEGDEPYKTLIENFSRKLVEYNVCVVVGYSFRDKRINEIFLKFLNTPDRKLIIVSPSGQENFMKTYENLLNEDSVQNYTFIPKILSTENINEIVTDLKSVL